MSPAVPAESIRSFAKPAAWASWLAKNYATSSGVWLRLAKKSSGASSVTYAEAIEAALCYGWIDGQKKPDDERYWLQRFTPRSRASISKINREKALALIASGRMRAGGLQEVERARKDGRWERAYDSIKTSTVPADLQSALNRNARARAFFATLNSQNRYAVLFRIQTAKRAETRAARIRKFVEMLGRHEKLHP